MLFPQDLQPGDVLLYASRDVADALIEWKEADAGPDVAAHVEVYFGNGMSWASRNGIGVNAYAFRPDGLHQVRRPVGRFDGDAARAWFNAGVRGLPYGWGDILASVNLAANLRGVDCSHFAAAMLEMARCAQFDPVFPKNKVTPRDFKLSREALVLWEVAAPAAIISNP